MAKIAKFWQNMNFFFLKLEFEISLSRMFLGQQLNVMQIGS